MKERKSEEQVLHFVPKEPSVPVPPQVRSAVELALRRYAAEPGALLPILHSVQDALGYVPPEVAVLLAPALQRSRAEVHGVITYYHHFRQQALRGRHIQICRAEACQASGGEALWHAAVTALGTEHTVESVYCLGLCANSPAALVDDQLLVHADVATLQKRVAWADSSASGNPREAI